MFDLLMDRPGERLSADRIAVQLPLLRQGDGAGMPGRHSVASILTAVSRPHARFGRRCAGVAPGVHDRVARAHRNLRHAGISLFADPAPAISPSEVLLRSPFLVQQVEQALV